MIHSILIEKVRGSSFLQFLLGFLPVIFIIGYIFLYMYDIVNIVGVLNYNDKIVVSGLASESLIGIDSYEQLSDSIYLVNVDEDELELSVNFCTSLPDDRVWYDVNRNTLVKNIIKDFDKNIIFGSNIIVVLTSMCIYCVLLYFVGKKYCIDTFHSREVLFANVFSIVILSSCIFITLLII